MSSQAEQIIIFIISILSASILIITALSISIRQFFTASPPDWQSWLLFLIAPYGLSISVFLYIFFWGDVQILSLLSVAANFPLLLNVIVNVLGVSLFLIGLYYLYRSFLKGDRIFVIIFILCFCGLCWLYVSILFIHEQQINSWPKQHYDFPLMQWCIAFYIATFWVSYQEKIIKRPPKDDGDPKIE